jgi:hypothetical protein
MVQDEGIFGMAFSPQEFCFTTQNRFCFVNPQYSGDPYRWISMVDA